jgi:mannose/fructose-specific phosphotransferase system component IIA
MNDRRPAGENSGARGIVVGHGDLARGLVDAVRRIAGGAADTLTPLSNEGRSPQQLVADLEAMAGNGPVIVFVDLQTGSCGLAAQVSSRDNAARAVVCGVNLPMLLDFVFNRTQPVSEIAQRLVELGRGSIQPAQPPR